MLAMSVVSFGGPFVMLGILRGGESPRLPPDRPVEWFVIGLVFGLFLVLFVACVSIRSWFRPGRASEHDVVSRDGGTHSNHARRGRVGRGR
jgi:hypothetical protein